MHEIFQIHCQPENNYPSPNLQHSVIKISRDVTPHTGNLQRSFRIRPPIRVPPTTEQRPPTRGPHNKLESESESESGASAAKTVTCQPKSLQYGKAQNMAAQASTSASSSRKDFAQHASHFEPIGDSQAQYLAPKLGVKNTYCCTAHTQKTVGFNSSSTSETRLQQ
jgi:hypothetical protein